MVHAVDDPEISRVLLSRYQNALEKANYASLALKQEQEQAAAANAEAEAEDEEELQVCYGALTAQQARFCFRPHVKRLPLGD